MFHTTLESRYDIRPAPVGTSAATEDAFSHSSSAKPLIPHQQAGLHMPSHHKSVPTQSMTIEDSLRLAKLRLHNRSANIPQTSHRHQFGVGSKLLQGLRKSMPALHLNNPLTARAPTAPVMSDSYLQHAYERMLQRRSLLTAIRYVRACTAALAAHFIHSHSSFPFLSNNLSCSPQTILYM